MWKTRKKWYNSNRQQMRKKLNRLGRILAKNGTTQIVNKCEKNLKPVGTSTRKKWYNSNYQQMRKKLKTDWDEYSQKMVPLKLSTNAKKT